MKYSSKVNYILNKLKGAVKYGGKALGGLAGAASIYEYYEGFQEAKKDKYRKGLRIMDLSKNEGQI